jgi:hypothetical protein
MNVAVFIPEGSHLRLWISFLSLAEHWCFASEIDTDNYAQCPLVITRTLSPCITLRKTFQFWFDKPLIALKLRNTTSIFRPISALSFQ